MAWLSQRRSCGSCWKGEGRLEGRECWKGRGIVARLVWVVGLLQGWCGCARCLDQVVYSRRVHSVFELGDEDGDDNRT